MTLATLCRTEKRIGAAKRSNLRLIRKLKRQTCVIWHAFSVFFSEFFSKTAGPQPGTEIRLTVILRILTDDCLLPSITCAGHGKNIPPRASPIYILLDRKPRGCVRA
jgi:hypothetical protein